MNWGRALGFTYAVLLAFGAVLALLWGLFDYHRFHNLITTLSTAVSGFATYAVALVAIHSAGHQLGEMFEGLYNGTKAWKLPGSHDQQVAAAGVAGIVLGYALWQ